MAGDEVVADMAAHLTPDIRVVRLSLSLSLSFSLGLSPGETRGDDDESDNLLERQGKEGRTRH